MHAAVLTDDHRFVVETLPDPTPGPADLVLRVEACGICGSDLKAHGHMPGGIVMGHEFCGEVVAVGGDVADRWREGDLVAAMPLNACGRCRWCLADDPAHSAIAAIPSALLAVCRAVIPRRAKRSSTLPTPVLSIPALSSASSNVAPGGSIDTSRRCADTRRKLPGSPSNGRAITRETLCGSTSSCRATSHAR